MPWTDHPGPTPHRSQEQLLAGVRRRAAAIRRGRRARLSAAMGGVVAVLLVATALAGAGDGPSTELQVVGPAPTTPAPTTTTTVYDHRVACEASAVMVTATPDRKSYPKGSRVVVTAAALNRGSRPCLPYDPSIQFFDAAGAAVGGVSVSDAFTMGVVGEPPPTWDPGQTLSFPFEWPQSCGSGGTCPPGQYTVVVTFGPFRSAPASFSVT